MVINIVGKILSFRILSLLTMELLLREKTKQMWTLKRPDAKKKVFHFLHVMAASKSKQKHRAK